MAEEQQQPDERPKPKYGELAPPGWVWHPPEDADRLDTSRPASGESAPAEEPAGQYGGAQHGGPYGPQAPQGPNGQHGPHGPYPGQPRPGVPRTGAPRWNLTATLLLIVFGFFGMTYSIGVLQAFPASMQLVHSSQGLGPYVQAPSVGPLLTAGSIVMAGLWAVSTGLSVWLLVQKRMAFYIPLIAGVIAFIVLFVFLVIVIMTDPSLLDFYSGVSPSPTPTPTP